ncbi:MAG: hypothetical protein RIA63_09870, partial [Cyclobacteriaceae bacterium]
RYYPGGWIESATIFDSMHQPMVDYPDCFGFTEKDFPASLFYNFVMWFSVVMLFHLGQRSIKGTMMVRSFIFFGLSCLFFISLAAIYMNHYIQGIRVFYLFSMLDGIIIFSLLALINGFLYPKIFPTKS